MRSLIILALLTSTAFAGFLLDDQGGRLTDGKCGPFISEGIHCLEFTTGWGTGQQAQIGFDVKADKSGIRIGGFATDTSSTIVSTEIAYVPSPNTYVPLQTCMTDECGYLWPTSAMPSGQANEIIFFLTNARGERFGASTRISKPQ